MGRPRKWASEADRLKAYRASKKAGIDAPADGKLVGEPVEGGDDIDPHPGPGVPERKLVAIPVSETYTAEEAYRVGYSGQPCPESWQTKKFGDLGEAWAQGVWARQARQEVAAYPDQKRSVVELQARVERAGEMAAWWKADQPFRVSYDARVAANRQRQAKKGST